MCTIGICHQEGDAAVSLNDMFDYSEIPLSFLERPVQTGIVNVAMQPAAEVVMGVFPRGTALYGSERLLEAAASRIEDVVRILRGAQIKGLTFGAGAVRAVPHGIDRSVAERRLAEILRLLFDQCAKSGVELYVENLPSVQTNILNTVKETVLFFDRYALGAKMVFDLRAARIERDDPIAALEYLERIGHVHLPCQPSDDSQNVDTTTFVGRLFDAGYRGRISIEPFPAPLGRSALTAAARVRQIIVARS